MQTESKKYVGFARVRIAAVNPTREQLNRMLRVEDSVNEKPIQYLDKDEDGNRRLRLVFWLYDKKVDTFFSNEFYLIDKVNVNNAYSEEQYINSVFETAWADSDGNLPVWFTNILDKKMRPVGNKSFKKALIGEEELGALLRYSLRKAALYDVETELSINTESLFAGDYSELEKFVDSDDKTTFVALIGVRTDSNDRSKQFQQVYNKQFLPEGFMLFIRKDFKFPTEFSKKTWAEFVSNFNEGPAKNVFYKLQPLKEYVIDDDSILNENEI